MIEVEFVFGVQTGGFNIPVGIDDHCSVVRIEEIDIGGQVRREKIPPFVVGHEAIESNKDLVRMFASVVPGEFRTTSRDTSQGVVCQDIPKALHERKIAR